MHWRQQADRDRVERDMQQQEHVMVMIAVMFVALVIVGWGVFL